MPRFDIDEKMALPILLRGLGQLVDWINLKHAPINNGTVTEILQNPEVSRSSINYVSQPSILEFNSRICCT